MTKLENNILVEGEHGHGAIGQRNDVRDTKYADIAMASAPFNWVVGYDVETDIAHEQVTKDQGVSFSCGGQSGAYLNEILSVVYKNAYTPKSARYIYSQIFYPNGGTTLRDILDLLVKKGACSEKTYISYQNGVTPPTEAFMQDKSGINALIDDEADNSEASGYAFLDHSDIDAIAQGIRDNKGAILQITGQNNGTWDSNMPIPPNNRVRNWSHFVFAGKAKMIDGKKYIGFHNSWGNDVGEKGWQWLSEDYFTSGNVTNAGVIYAKSNPVIVDNTQQKITIIKQLLGLYQQLMNLILGPTKIKK